jgi:RNA polymerase sigma factor (TIGR02999 family)
MNSDQESITRLLQEWSNGDKMALDQLMPLVYEQLHKLAMRCMRSERQDHTLRATALVHEAYVRLVKANVSFKDRAHFYAVSARLLRRILVDHARSLHSDKRGQGADWSGAMHQPVR